MLKIYKYCLLLLSCYSAHAQSGWYGKGKIFIAENTIVSISGNLVHENQGSEFFNAGNISITGDLIHSGTEKLFEDSYELGKGKIVLSGDLPQSIICSEAACMATLEINNTQYLLLHNDVQINNQFIISSGNIRMSYYDIFLQRFTNMGVSRFGTIVSEREDNRITGKTGLIKVEDFYLSPGSINVAGTGFYISLPYFIPSLSICRGHEIQTAADNSISRFFDITAGYTGATITQLRLFYLDNEWEDSGVDEQEFRLFYSEFPVNSFVKQISNLSPFNYVSSNNIGLSLGRYTISDQNCDSNPEISIIGDSVICPGDILNLQATPDYSAENSYYWSSSDLGFEEINNHNLSLSGSEFENPGEYQINLIARNTRGCESFENVVIKVNPFPNVDFSFNQAAYCNNQIIEFSAPLGLTNYQWNLGNGVTTNADEFNYSFYEEGIYNISLSADSIGCASELSKNLIVFPKPQVDFNIIGECLGLEIIFQNSSLLSSSFSSPEVFSTVWEFENGETEFFGGNNLSTNHTYSEAGQKDVKLIVTSNQNCTDSASQILDIKSVFPGDFQVSDVCKYNEAEFINNSPFLLSASYDIDFGDGVESIGISAEENIAHLYIEPGEYLAKIIYYAPNYCNDTILENLIVHEVPNANFIANNVCFESSVEFLSVNPAQPGDVFFWEFGDGVSSEEISNEYNYNASGTYFPSLLITNEHNCLDSFSSEIHIYQLPTPEIIDEGHCINNPVLLSTVSEGNEYIWTFGDDSSTETLEIYSNTSHVYSNTGIFSIHLLETNEYGCSQWDEKNIEIMPKPEITLNDSTKTCAVYCILNAGILGNIYLWSNDSTTHQISVSEEGAYSVTVTDPISACSDFKETIVVLDSELNVSLGENFSACDFTILNPGYYYDWNWSNGSETQTITVSETGNYSVTVSDFAGCEAADEIYIQIFSTPYVSVFGDTSGCENEDIQVFATSDAFVFMWNTGESANEIFIDESGIYWVTVTGEGGCENISEPISVMVYPLPVVFLGNDTIACNQILLDAGNSGCSYLWQNGNCERFLNVEEGGSYSVIVSSTENCISSDSIYIEINYLPEIELGPDISACEGTNVLLRPLDSLSGYEYQWNLPFSGEELVIGVSGEYSLCRTGENGCTDIDTIMVQFFPLPELEIEDMLMCSETGVEVEIFEFDSVFWYSGNEEISNSNSVVILNTGAYHVVVWNEFKCQFTDSFMVDAFPFSIYPHFLVSSLAKVGDTLHFISLSQPEPDSYYWLFNDGGFSDKEDPLYTYYIEGFYDVEMNVTKANCLASFSKNIEIAGFNKYYLDIIDSAEFQPVSYIDFSSLNIYPNPCMDRFSLDIQLTGIAEIAVDCHDIAGRKVFADRKGGSREFLLNYNSEDFSPGLYIISIRTGVRTRNLKLIKF